MRSAWSDRTAWLRGLAVAAGAAVFVGGCTTGGGGDDTDPPEAGFDFDAGLVDAQIDAFGFPDATIDPCRPDAGTIGNACTSDDGCQDGCYCNGRELCNAGVCAAGVDPCADSIECTESACLEETDTCFLQPRHEMCSDGDACTGVELCSTDLGCTFGTPPYCNDESSCTVDSCDPVVGCVYEARDLDGDGFTDGRCGGDDCDDDPRYGTMIYPGAPENCTNRRDDNCDGFRDFNDATCLPMNDTCATATVLSGPGTYSGSVEGLAGNYTLSCRPSGPDAVFKFTLTEPKDVRVSAVGAAGFAVAIRPFAQCATGPDDKCNASMPASMLRRSLPAGEWAIVVKGSSGVPFDLVLMYSDPTPIPRVDVCNAMTQDISAGGMFTGSFEEVENDYALSCHGFGEFKDAVYRFTLTEPKDVTITASTTSSSWMPQTYINVTTDCASAMAGIACEVGAPGMFRRRELPAGTYYVVLESSNTDATTWTMNVSITDPAPRNPADACSSVVDITDTMGSASLGGLELDYGTSCGGATTGYRDAVFKFTLTSPRDVDLVTNAASGFHYVGVGTECGSLASEIRCRSGSSPQALSWRSLPAGTYYAIVSTNFTFGTITARATTSPPTMAPPNDRCDGAIDVSGGYSRVDTLIAFEDDTRGCSGTGYPDAFYKFTLTERQNVTLVASRTAGTAPIYLTLRSNCASTTSLACEPGDHPAVIDQTLDPGSYVVVAEMTEATTSNFRFSAFFSDP